MAVAVGWDREIRRSVRERDRRQEEEREEVEEGKEIGQRSERGQPQPQRKERSSRVATTTTTSKWWPDDDELDQAAGKAVPRSPHCESKWRLTIAKFSLHSETQLYLELEAHIWSA